MIDGLDDYYRYKRNANISKHKMLSDLEAKHYPDISADYDWLLSMSMTARYANYQQDKIIAQKARNLMKKIKTFCVP